MGMRTASIAQADLDYSERILQLVKLMIECVNGLG